MGEKISIQIPREKGWGSVMHTIIIGMTESGKTSIAKMICEGLKKKKKKTAVLDPLLDPDWDADFITADKDEFITHCKAQQNLYIFIDEGSESVGRYDTTMQWFATQSRHWGHSCFFISQGITQMSPIIADQSSRAIVFSVSYTNIDIIAEKWNMPELRKVPRMEKGEFYVIDRFNPLQRGKVDFAEWKAYYEPVGTPKESKRVKKPGAKNSPDSIVNSGDVSANG